MEGPGGGPAGWMGEIGFVVDLLSAHLSVDLLSAHPGENVPDSVVIMDMGVDEVC